MDTSTKIDMQEPTATFIAWLRQIGEMMLVFTAPLMFLIWKVAEVYNKRTEAQVKKDKDFIIPNTIVEINENESDSLNFKGKLLVYDSFITKQVINLYVEVETFYCEIKNKYVLLFRISSLNFENGIWKLLKNVILTKNHCEK